MLEISLHRGSLRARSVDLDIEGGGTTGYAAFVTRLRSYFSGASKQYVYLVLSPPRGVLNIVSARYYITAAPQCVYPDANLGAVLNAVAFDAIYVQFCTSTMCFLSTI